MKAGHCFVNTQQTHALSRVHRVHHRDLSGTWSGPGKLQSPAILSYLEAENSNLTLRMKSHLCITLHAKLYFVVF